MSWLARSIERDEYSLGDASASDTKMFAFDTRVNTPERRNPYVVSKQLLSDST